MYDPARVWRFTGNPFGHGGLRFIGNPAGGSEERQDPVAQKAVYGRPVHVMVGWFMLWWAGLRVKHREYSLMKEARLGLRM